tara:strand:- start:1403 stop:1804 length:402 start_codon:yes stop_codon:yes gene_type:complete
MNKEIARKVRAWFPGLFSLIERNFLVLSFITELDRPKYIYAKLTGQPYFGGLYLASQTWPERKEYMRNAIRSELENHQRGASEFCMIEIGSWAGESAVLWANELKNLEESFCVSTLGNLSLEKNMAPKMRPPR